MGTHNSTCHSLGRWPRDRSPKEQQPLMDQELLKKKRTHVYETENTLHRPAIWGESDITWKSIIELSMWSTFVVWPRSMVRKNDDGFDGCVGFVVCCWSLWDGIPPEKMINDSPLKSWRKDQRFRSSLTNESTYELFMAVHITLLIGPNLCASSLQIRARTKHFDQTGSCHRRSLTMWIIDANRFISCS